MSGRPASDYTRCPRCRHRTVLFHYGRNGEDYLACHYHVRFSAPCGWEVFRWADRYDTETDRRERLAWETANPNRSDDH